MTAIVHAPPVPRAGHRTASRTTSASARPSRNTLTMAYRGLLKITRTPEQLFDVTLQPIIFTLMFTYIFGGAIAGDVHELPADHHPRHPGADGHHDLGRHRHPAARGHGQGRLRPLPVPADRAHRAAVRRAARRHGAVRDRDDASRSRGLS